MTTFTQPHIDETLVRRAFMRAVAVAVLSTAACALSWLVAAGAEHLPTTGATLAPRAMVPL